MSYGQDREPQPSDYTNWDYDGITHTTKDGREIPLSELGDEHLENIIRFFENKAKAGVKVAFGGGVDADDIYYDEEILYGKEALKELNYDAYVNELKRRKTK